MASTSRWSLDYSPPPTSTPAALDPPGYTSSLKGSSKNATAMIKHANLGTLRQQKAWEVAMAPAKSVPMQAFMMYMTGNSVQIFSVMSVWQCLKAAVGGIASVDKVFLPFTGVKSKPVPSPSSSSSTATPESDASFLLQKATFVACQMGLLAVGLWKMNQLGLLPTHESDWLAFREMNVWDEASSVSMGLQPGL